MRLKKILRDLEIVSDYVRSLKVLSNGDLAGGTNMNNIKIWNTTTWSVKKTLTGHTGAVSALTTLSNGDLVSGSADRLIKIWSTSSNN